MPSPSLPTLPVTRCEPPVGGAARHVYVHVPFCRHRCGYCDFALVADRDDLIERYLEALERELERLAPAPACDTLYLGGGTPSHLGPAGLRRLFTILRQRLTSPPEGGPEAEVTLEANPSDVTPELVAAARDCGVNRMSLGAQSLDAATLRALDRDHDPADVRAAAELLLAAGLRLNVDLMIAAPGTTVADVERDLDAVVGLGCDHVSVYCLTWEKGTAFEAARRRELVRAVDESQEQQMFETAIDRLERAGYEHYEVSNFARPGCRCRHNEAYWDCRPWEGFGPGAARFDGRTRVVNHRSVVAWIDRVLAGREAHGEVERMTAEEAARERVVVGLRRRDGLSRAAFREAAGFDLDAIAGGAIRRWVAAGQAVDDGERVRLTRAGLLVSDGLWAEVLTGRGA